MSAAWTVTLFDVPIEVPSFDQSMTIESVKSTPASITDAVRVVLPTEFLNMMPLSVMIEQV